VQLALVCAVIVHYGLTPLPGWLLTGAIGLTALTTVWSGAAYVWHWGRLARRWTQNPTRSSLDDVP
jgi:cardiolipin synthase